MKRLRAKTEQWRYRWNRCNHNLRNTCCFVEISHCKNEELFFRDHRVLVLYALERLADLPSVQSSVIGQNCEKNGHGLACVALHASPMPDNQRNRHLMTEILASLHSFVAVCLSTHSRNMHSARSIPFWSLKKFNEQTCPGEKGNFTSCKTGSGHFQNLPFCCQTSV